MKRCDHFSIFLFTYAGFLTTATASTDFWIHPFFCTGIRFNPKNIQMAPRCPKRPCGLEQLSDYMMRAIHLIRENQKITDCFRYSEIIEIIHGCVTAFADEPTLLQFRLPQHGLVVIGDIHGDAYCVFKAFEFYGFPPDISYLFLGDYVDRGPKQNEILLFLLLMKLCWPEHVFLLRGNHELYDMTKASFMRQCSKDFRGSQMFYQLNQLFDYLPLGAIVSDYFFLCHGGVSQWMTCRANIASIKKPTDMSYMKILEACIVTDILWADPCPTQREPFRLSVRGCSYSFNGRALQAVLRALNVRKLIRGHQITTEAVSDIFGDGSCITVHTAPRQKDGYFMSGTIRIICDENGEFSIESRVIEMDENPVIDPAYETVLLMLQDSLNRTTLYRTIPPKCLWCRKAMPGNVPVRVRYATIQEVDRWIARFAMELVKQDAFFHQAWRRKHHRVMNVRAYELFPVVYDMFSFAPMRDGPGTYRVIVSTSERNFIRKCYPEVSCDYEIPEPLLNDTDPGFLEEQHRRQRSSGLRRASRRIANALRHFVGLSDLPSEEEEE